MAPAGATRSLSRPTSVTEAVRSHVATHGRGTSRWLAQQYGVSQRTAQRWLAGTQQPRSSARVAQVLAGANERQVRVNALRMVSTVKLGRVTFWDKSAGKMVQRDLGNLEVNMSPVAALLEAGGSEGEADALAAQIYMESYFGGDWGGDYPIEIDDYGSDPEFF